jgi:hypothetical protein
MISLSKVFEQLRDNLQYYENDYHSTQQMQKEQAQV